MTSVLCDEALLLGVVDSKSLFKAAYVEKLRLF